MYVDEWLIVKRDLYYMPEAQGYTGIRDQAGRWPHAEAKTYAHPDGGVEIVNISDAPEFRDSCFDDLARKHLIVQRDALRNQLRELGLEPVA